MRQATFVGRDEELAALRRAFAIDGPRVVYLHGPGGVGGVDAVLITALQRL